MDVNIRLAIFDDVPAILEISNHYALTTPANFAEKPESLEMWQESWRQTHAMHPWLVAIRASAAKSTGGVLVSAVPPVGDSIIGFAKSSPWKGRCAYNWTAEVTVYVRHDAHGRGVGRALYGRLIEILRAQGYRTLLGGITQPNEASVRLHESLGFRPVALLERVGWKFGRWHDVGYWELVLGDANDAPSGLRQVDEVVPSTAPAAQPM